MRWLWCKGYPIWFTRLFWQMNNAFEGLVDGIWLVVYNFFAIIFILLHFIINTILTPIADIFKFGTPYND